MGQGSSTPEPPAAPAHPAPAVASTVASTTAAPRAEGEEPRRASVVSVGDVIARCGHIPVTGRYAYDRPIAEEYEIDSKVVGSGMSGPVQLATCRADGKKCAVKSFRKRGLPAKRRAELKSEVEIYLTLDHPHIARLEKVFETEDDVHLVMEFMAGGELYDRLSQRKRYSEEDAAETTYQMLLAVAYLHGRQIAHRDLKLENFLYEAKETNHLKLIDFGFAKLWDRSATMSQACGSVHYVAPEVLAHSYTERADMWSLGVIVYMLLTGSPPFHGSDKEILSKIKAGDVQWSSRFNKLTPLTQGFVKGLLVADPEKRLSAEQALEHDWIKSKNTQAVHDIDMGILQSLRNFSHASSFRRAVLSMMAWSLSADDRMHLREQFLSMDTENKGTITHSQMKRVLEENFHVDNAEAEALFRSLDTDNDDEIAYSEFLAAALQGQVEVHEELLRKTFAKFDTEGQNKISAEGLKAVLGDQFEGKEIEELIKEADKDQNGTIDYDEFLAYFHKIDTSHNELTPGGGSRKHEHTEKLGLVLDRLISQAHSELELTTADGSPSTSPSHMHKPLQSRTLRKARTMV